MENFLAGVQVDSDEFDFMDNLCFHINVNKCGRCVSKYIQIKAFKFLLER